MTLTALTAGALGGCKSPAVSASARSTGSAPAVVTSAAAATTPAATTPAATTAAATKPAPSKPRPKLKPTRPKADVGSPTADRTLSDDGIGGLSLGQSRKAALATGLLGRKDARFGGVCSRYYGLGGVLDATLDGHSRVVLIRLRTTVRLDTGIGVGNTFRDLHRFYPVTVFGEPGMEPGEISIPAPGAAVPAHYEVYTADTVPFPDSKIDNMVLNANNDPCIGQ